MFDFDEAPLTGLHMPLVLISNTIVSCFEEKAMSLSVFSSSSRCLLLLHLVLCRGFIAMSLVGI